MPRKYTRKAKPAAKPKKPKAKPAPKKRAVKVPVKAEPVKEQPVAVKKALPIVDGVQILEILSTGHGATTKHCRLADGTTRHVDNSLFN